MPEEDFFPDGERYFRFLFENMLEGYAFCQMIYDSSNKPVDFVYLNTNKSFYRLTGLENANGKKVTELVPGIRESNPELFEIYNRVAQTGKPERFETEVKPLSLWLNISVYSPKKGYFVAVFNDITENKKAIERQKQKNEQLEKMNNLMVDRELKMVELKKEIESLRKQLESIKKTKT